MKSQLFPSIPSILEPDQARMLPPEAQKKMQCWIRSRHLICSGNFFVFETVNFSAVDRFSTCVASLGGTVISVDPIDKIWMGDHRQVLLYRSKASLHAPCHTLRGCLKSLPDSIPFMRESAF